MKLRFSQNIKKLRINNSMTQEELAVKLGVTSQSVSRWETGATYPDIELLPIIASMFDVSIDKLLGFDPESRLQYAWNVINDNFLKRDDVEKRIRAIRNIYLENQNNQEIKKSYLCAVAFSDSLSAFFESLPDVVDEVKKIGYEFLNDASISQKERDDIVVCMSIIEKEEQLPEFFSKYVSEINKDIALDVRYTTNKDYKRANHQMQLSNFGNMRKVLGRTVYKYYDTSNNRRGKRKYALTDHSNMYEDCVTALNTIAAISGVSESDYPISGDGKPDIFIGWRRNWGIRYAACLAEMNKSEEMYRVLDDLISISKKIWSFSSHDTLDNRGGMFCDLRVTVEPLHHVQEAIKVSSLKESTMLGLYENDICIDEIYSTYPFLFLKITDVFDPYRNEERFRKIYNSALELNVSRLDDDRVDINYIF